MLQYLISVIQNTIPTVIVMAIMLAFVIRANEGGRKKFAIAGLLTGLVIAIILSVLKLTTGFVVREYYNLAVLVPTIIAELVFLLFLLLPIKEKAKALPLNIAIFFISCGWVAFAMPDLIMYPSDFTVMSGTIFSTAFLFKVIGYVFGILVSFLSLFFLYKIVKELPLKAIKIALTLSIFTIMTQELFLAIQILIVRGLIPRIDWLSEVVICVINHGNIFMYLSLAIGLILTVILIIQIRFTKHEAPNPALIRKLKASLRKQSRYAMCFCVCVIISILTVTVGVAYDSKEVVISDAIPTEVIDGKIIIPADTVSDGGLHRFGYTASDGTKMRFIIIKKNDVAFGIGLDACDICGDSGYYEEKGKVICSLCDVVMNIQTIGFAGGCNPVPLKYELVDGNIVIDAADLEAEKQRFQ